jgi:hypothetical protein
MGLAQVQWMKAGRTQGSEPVYQLADTAPMEPRFPVGLSENDGGYGPACGKEQRQDQASQMGETVPKKEKRMAD